MNNNNNNNLIKSSKKTISWAKKLEDIKIISPSKKYLENKENINNNEIIDKNNDYQDILKLKIKNLRIQIQDEIDIERKQYIQDKIDFYVSKINYNNHNHNNNLHILSIKTTIIHFLFFYLSNLSSTFIIFVISHHFLPDLFISFSIRILYFVSEFTLLKLLLI